MALMKPQRHEKNASLGLVYDLLCHPTHYDRTEALPEEVKCVFLAFSCQQGPLKEFIVTSPLCTEGDETSRQPGLLSLLPKKYDLWVNETLDKCSGDLSDKSYADKTR